MKKPSPWIFAATFLFIATGLTAAQEPSKPAKESSSQDTLNCKCNPANDPCCVPILHSRKTEPAKENKDKITDTSTCKCDPKTDPCCSPPEGSALQSKTQNNRDPNVTSQQNGKPPAKEMDVITEVRAKLAEDPLLNPLDIKATQGSGGDIQLQGEVETDLQFEQAVTTVYAVKGVDQVDTSMLKIKKSEHPVQDTLLTAKVKAAIIRATLLNEEERQQWPFTIESKDNIVYIKGNVKKEETKQGVIKTIEAIPGVQSVKADITVSESSEKLPP